MKVLPDFHLVVEPNCVRPTVAIDGERLTVTVPPRFEMFAKTLMHSCLDSHGNLDPYSLPYNLGLSIASAGELFPQDAYDAIVSFGKTRAVVVRNAKTNEFMDRLMGQALKEAW